MAGRMLKLAFGMTILFVPLLLLSPVLAVLALFAMIPFAIAVLRL